MNRKALLLAIFIGSDLAGTRSGTKLIVELFPNVGTVRGTLLIQSSGRVNVVALQQTGLVLGTLPPVID